MHMHTDIQVVFLLQKPLCVKQPVGQDWMPHHVQEMFVQALQVPDWGIHLSIFIQFDLMRIQFGIFAMNACDEYHNCHHFPSQVCHSQWNDDDTEEMVGRRLFVTYSPNCHQFPVQGRSTVFALHTHANSVDMRWCKPIAVLAFGIFWNDLLTLIHARKQTWAGGAQTDVDAVYD